MAFVGDSIARNQVESLLCLINSSNPLMLIPMLVLSTEPRSFI
ncbi:hypothetical protein glysoja_036087 [Glycine soja]|uniref:Trichome birefringence-like C-terminal domain-containing protein n=1 Tax=Glycine soja TaxID=3848 RepID=A0A0B2QG35_GLYSO|nr:hypothetical protein glysoja_036087 [Glycine soja]